MNNSAQTNELNSAIIRGTVKTEGDDLYYEVRGTGMPLIMIAAAGGDGDYYAPIADKLSDSYKVITYDRRSNARSTMNHPNEFSIEQQSRDAVAILHAAGGSQGVFFGNSSGAVIALDIAKTQPGSALLVIAHEPPIPYVLPDAEKWSKFFNRCKNTAVHFGSSIGALRFLIGANIGISDLAKLQRAAARYASEKRGAKDAPRLPVKKELDFLMKQELLPITGYQPDFQALKKSGVKICIGIGKATAERNTWLYQVCKRLASECNASLTSFPGGHGGYMGDATGFSEVLRKVISEATDA